MNQRQRVDWAFAKTACAQARVAHPGRLGKRTMASSLFRIVIGLALIVFAIALYSKNSAQIAAGGQVRIFGVSAGSTGWLSVAFVVIGLIGVLFVILGIVGFLKQRQ